MVSEFSLLSINTFGIPFFLAWGRLKRLARELERQPVQILCLQELQQTFYSGLFKRSLPSHPYQIVHHNRFAPKGGLGTFSNVPTDFQAFEVYQDRGVWWSMGFADWALYKGVLSVHLQINKQQIIVLNTHVHANYTGDWRRENPVARLQHRQVLQLARIIRMQPNDALVILCGDFNFPRQTFLYEDLIAEAGLTDPLANDPTPTYRPFPLVPSRWNISLDHLLVRYPQGRQFDTQATVLAIEDSSKKYAYQRFLTDHCALTLRVRWEDTPEANLTHANDAA